MSSLSMRARMLSNGLYSVAISFILCAIILSFGWFSYSDKERLLEDADNNLSEAKVRLREVIEAQAIIRDYKQAYDSYQTSGLIGAEDRLKWVQDIVSLSEKMKFPRLEYSISPRELSSMGNFLMMSDYAVFSNKMTITLETLHEGDVFYFLNAMKKRSSDILSVSECHLNSLGAEVQVKTLEANVLTECNLSWFTIDKRIANQSHEDHEEVTL